MCIYIYSLVQLGSEVMCPLKLRSQKLLLEGCRPTVCLDVAYGKGIRNALGHHTMGVRNDIAGKSLQYHSEFLASAIARCLLCLTSLATELHLITKRTLSLKTDYGVHMLPHIHISIT